jgi:hypothetical protein
LFVTITKTIRGQDALSEVTFEKTQPRSQLVFKCAGDEELGEEIFREVDHEHGDDEDGSEAPMAEHVPTTSTMIENGPSPTPTMAKPRSRRSCY